MKSKTVLIVAIVATFLAVSCTPTTTPASATTSEVAVSTTSTSSVLSQLSVEDFVFFAGSGASTSAVLDTKDFTKAAITLKCDSDLYLKIQVSSDGVNWIDQFDYYQDVCRQGKTENFNITGRYYRAWNSNPAATINMIGRFSS